MKKLVYILLFLIVSCYSSGNLEFTRMFIENNSDIIKILRNNKTQIKLSIIDKNKGFNEYEYNVDANQYFYPASTVKLPIALFALEKLNEHKYLSVDTPFMLEDDTLKTTMRRELEKIFIISDNQANNRLFEFLGQDYINQKFISKGMNESRIFHRLSTTNSSNLNGKRVDFFLNDSIISFQNKNIAPSKLNLKGVKKGIGYWKPMGAENSALWQIDSEDSGMEKAYCCIAATARDFARFGKLYINKGKWNDKIILDSSFIELSVNPVFDDSKYYGYGWWLYNYEGKRVFTMNGHRGQFVISFPDENIIIVRQGDYNNKGNVNEGAGDLFQYISEGYKIATTIE